MVRNHISNHSLIGSGIAESVYRLVYEGATEESGFDFRQEQESIRYSIESRPTLGLTQPHMKWVLEAEAAYPWVKQKHKADHLPSSSVKVKNRRVFKAQ
jgi:hypothetical protein